MSESLMEARHRLSLAKEAKDKFKRMASAQHFTMQAVEHIISHLESQAQSPTTASPTTESPSAAETSAEPSTPHENWVELGTDSIEVRTQVLRRQLMTWLQAPGLTPVARFSVCWGLLEGEKWWWGTPAQVADGTTSTSVSQPSNLFAETSPSDAAPSPSSESSDEWLCGSVDRIHKSACYLRQGHEGKHVTIWGRSWDDEDASAPATPSSESGEQWITEPYMGLDPRFDGMTVLMGPRNGAGWREYAKSVSVEDAEFLAKRLSGTATIRGAAAPATPLVSSREALQEAREKSIAALERAEERRDTAAETEAAIYRDATPTPAPSPNAMADAYMEHAGSTYRKPATPAPESGERWETEIEAMEEYIRHGSRRWNMYQLEELAEYLNHNASLQGGA